MALQSLLIVDTSVHSRHINRRLRALHTTQCLAIQILVYFHTHMHKCATFARARVTSIHREAQSHVYNKSKKERGCKVGCCTCLGQKKIKRGKKEEGGASRSRSIVEKRLRGDANLSCPYLSSVDFIKKKLGKFLKYFFINLKD